MRFWRGERRLFGWNVWWSVFRSSGAIHWHRRPEYSDGSLGSADGCSSTGPGDVR